MSYPLFFHEEKLVASTQIRLQEDTARHIVQVLRMQAGGKLQLTDGLGNIAEVSIVAAEKKKCEVEIDTVTHRTPRSSKLHLGIAFTKNAGRNEWLLEKATELGVSSIIPIITTRTEKEKIRYDRWRSILIAALIQSQQVHLPALAMATTIDGILQRFNGVEQKIIGHCIDSEPRTPLSVMMKPKSETIVLIGPEGDFTRQEVMLCQEQGFVGVEMGRQRLRTETAAMTVCAYFNLINYEA